ncbi:MAG TPA: hypothetical protein VIZ28_11005 [Chitinophagaceae bacterium]
MKRLLLLLTVLSFSNFLFAYPITPCPLRKLVVESEYIVWATVLDAGSLKRTKKNEHVWERDFARIVIHEILQGKLKSDTILVYFTSGMICPAPGVLYEEETALVFLDKREKEDGYEIHALSYGVKHGLSETEYAIYRTRIKEMQTIIKDYDKKECTDVILDWLVKCAAEKCTRWEGVYELSPSSHFMSYYDHGETFRREIYLSSQQRKQLFEVLLAIDTLSYADMGLADITRGINDSALLEFLKVKLTRVEGPYFWEAKDIMRRIADLTDNNELRNILKKADDLYSAYTDEEKAEVKKILSDFIDAMKKASLKRNPTAFGDGNT